MNNIIEALQKLYVALGGQAADVANFNITPEMISAIADVIEGSGGSTLPAVSGGDNGKLLTVVEGGWDKADAPKELPAVDMLDVGKILTVKRSGTQYSWDKYYPNYVQSIVYEGTYNPSDPSEIGWHCTTDFEQVKSAEDGGQIFKVYVRLEGNPEIMLTEAVFTKTEGENPQIVAVSFVGVGVMDGVPVYLQINHTSDAITHSIIPLQTVSQ